MYKRIHGNLESFVPPPVRQGSGKLTRFACSNKGLRSDAMLAHEENSNVLLILHSGP